MIEHDRASGPFIAILFTNRAIYLEAYPTLLSDETFQLQLCRRDHNRLNSIGSQGRNDLRNLTILTNDNPYDPHYMHTAAMFDLLSMCANLALTTKINIGEFITLDLGGFLMKLHG